jgi:hypothetical protein
MQVSLAAATTTLARIQDIAPGVWLRIGAAILALIVIVVILRKVAGMNKVILAVIVGLIVTIIGFNWIYQRNEPAWATPVIAPLSKFFPTKDSMK